MLDSSYTQLPLQNTLYLRLSFLNGFWQASDIAENAKVIAAGRRTYSSRTKENSQISITGDTVRFHAEKYGCIAIYSFSTLYLLQGVPLSSLAHTEEEKRQKAKHVKSNLSPTRYCHSSNRLNMRTPPEKKKQESN
jgi:hypothetical protein